LPRDRERVELTESVALSKFACPACGGEAVWNPTKGRLVCPFCGTESAAKPDRDVAVAEHDLLGALRAAPGAAGDAVPAKRQVKCQSCNAISSLDSSRQAQNCEFCGSAQLVPYAETTPAHRPESVLPFTLSESEARDGIRRWYGNLWLAPSALKKKALTDTVRGVYLPYWTFDAQVDAVWTAEAGHYYYTTETYEQGGRVQTRQVRHVRWEPAAGRVQQNFSLKMPQSLLAGPSWLFTKPIPGRFWHTAITTQQIVDQFIYGHMPLWHSCAGINQYFDDGRINFRVSTVSRRPKGLSQHSSTINILCFKRHVLFQ